MDIYEALRERRSIRKYKQDPVPEDKLLRILDAARLLCWCSAPTRKNLAIRTVKTTTCSMPDLPCSS